MNACTVAWPSGKKHGITELHPDVVSYVSHATQQRLQSLVEKISETAQQKNFSYKVTCGAPCWLVPPPHGLSLWKTQWAPGWGGRSGWPGRGGVTSARA